MKVISTSFGSDPAIEYCVFTLGEFSVWKHQKKLEEKLWKRDKSLQLFQFLLLSAQQKYVHKEQIIDRLWEDELGDGGFKVALHGLLKVLEPDKQKHADSRIVLRQGNSYKLNTDKIWVDSLFCMNAIELANRLVTDSPHEAISLYHQAIDLHKGTFLPDRIYEDWTAIEREKIQLMYQNACINLSELIIEKQPAEVIDLCEKVLNQDRSWEDSYRLMMKAYMHRGNRPMAIKTYQVCEQVLEEEMGLLPLPQTRKLYQKILAEGNRD
jgi:DNA-binding SARP family transcriptional activator